LRLGIDTAAVPGCAGARVILNAPMDAARVPGARAGTNAIVTGKVTAVHKVIPAERYGTAI